MTKAPEKIYNITFDEKARKKLNKNINIDNWDAQLKERLGREDIKNICLRESDFYNIENIIEKIEGEIKKEDKRSIYWHITGGQRIVAMAVAEFIKERENDKWLYMEGNIERLLVYDNKVKELEKDIAYGSQELSFEEVFALTGFNYNDSLKSTTILDMNPSIEESLEKEIKFYNVLYNIFCKEGSFRKSLLDSNGIKGKDCRIESIKKAFDQILERYDDELNDYNIFNSKEIKNNYPAGYIFEKIVGYKIYETLQNNKGLHNINQIGLSVKIHSKAEKKNSKIKKDNKIVDELDIVLLSSTGKLLNFECKVGGMEGDNAKSHNYTTYRLAGVFGMPILFSPLLRDEITDKEKEKEKEFSKQYKAIRSAENAGLYVCGIDEIKDRLKEFLTRYNGGEEKCIQKVK